MIIGTGGFTLEARREATRDGAPPIDLIDGRLLAEKLKGVEARREDQLGRTHRGSEGLVSIDLSFIAGAV